MIMNIIFIVLGLLGIFFSWLFTHLYYEKSLSNQQKEAAKEISEWKKLINAVEMNSKMGLRLSYIDKAVDEYYNFRTPRTPVRVIDTFDLPDSEKADIYDAVMMRVKGRVKKSNKYRN